MNNEIMIHAKSKNYYIDRKKFIENSEYFKALFENEFCEKNMTEINMDDDIIPIIKYINEMKQTCDYLHMIKSFKKYCLKPSILIAMTLMILISISFIPC